MRRLAAEGEDGLLRLEPLYGCEYACVMRNDHALAQPGALDLDAFCAADWLRVSFAGRPRGYVDEALARLGRERRVMITVSNFFTAGAVVHQSDLLTVLPRSFVPATGFAAQLALAEVPFEMPGIEVGLLWHRRHEQDTGQRWLRDTMRRAADDGRRGDARGSGPPSATGLRREQARGARRLVRRPAAGMRAQLAGQRGVYVLPAVGQGEQLACAAPLPLFFEAAPDGAPDAGRSLMDGCVQHADA